MTLFRALWRPLIAILALMTAGAAGLVGGPDAAQASPALVVDVDTGAVLYQDMATVPWFPASLTKLMTTYVALSKVREGKISLDTPLYVSARAASMAPSKMGFRPGTLVTLDNALKMLMVKSPNDVAVTIAEGISGSVETFAEEMNAYAAKLGLRESHFVNPNGLPDDRHVSSARDMALIGRALLREFPEQHGLFGIPALSFGGHIISNHNGLLGRYPGVDGMKTGYTCSAGYNVVASAERGNRRLIVVVMGSPSGHERNEKAAALFEKFFASSESAGSDVAGLPPSEIALAPDLRGQICGPGRRHAIEEAEADDAAIIPPAQLQASLGKPAERAVVLGAAAGPVPPAAGIVELLHPRDPFEPVRVFVGPVAGWTGSVAGPIEMSAPGPKATLAARDAARRVLPSGEAAPSDGMGNPLALAGAVAASPAIVAANRAVKAKGRLSLRVARHAPAAKVAAAAPKVAAPSSKAPPSKAPSSKAPTTKAPAPVRKVAAPSHKITAKAKPKAHRPDTK